MLLPEVIELIAKVTKTQEALPEPNEKGEYILFFDDDLEIKIYNFRNYVVFAGKIGPSIMSESPENVDMLRQMLQGNLGQTGDFFDILSFDKEERQIYLSRNVEESSLNEQNLEDVVRTFLEKVESWNESLLTPLTPGPQ